MSRALWRLGLGLALACLQAACTQTSLEPADGKPLYELSADEVVEPIPRPEKLVAAGNSSPYQVNGQTYQVMRSGAGYRERGIASWYGRKFHGRKTANGETFNAYRATAAHRSLPIPAWVRVTNLDNGRSMVVRVNDRGPFHPDRVIDLSYAAAVKLGFADRGTARVEVATIDVPGSSDLRAGGLLGTPRGDYRYIQVGAFSEMESARALGQRLEGQMNAPVAVSEIVLGDSAFYRVRVGPVDDHRRLLALQNQLRTLGFPETRLMPD
ncbi:MAG: septal ring lytic transglycosylase RlpA family protein [Halieaceae bacterium]|nr:septal ring lytic transglycosylase RlpA family protein [Halieaceae bacterium]